MRKRHNALAAFGRNVRQARESMGLTQQLLANKSGLSRTYLCDVERGLRNPNLLTVRRMAVALDRSVAALCVGIDQ
jgi:transcriptional regulator with XRE-family HTH domain